MTESRSPYGKLSMNLPCTFRFIEADPSHVSSKPNAGPARPFNGVTRDELAKAARMIEARAAMRAKIGQSDLPDIAKAQLRKQFEGMAHFTEANVDAAIENERDYLYRLFQNSVI